MKKIEINARVISATYKSTSYYGNPKYKVIFENLDTKVIFSGETVNNGACAYGINNSNLKISCKLTYHITRAGNVIINYIH